MLAASSAVLVKYFLTNSYFVKIDSDSFRFFIKYVGTFPLDGRVSFQHLSIL